MTSKKEILILGQALPKKMDDVPYSKTRLYRWFESIGIEKDEVLRIAEFEAVVDSFPGRNTDVGDRMPSKQEVIAHTERLKKKIREIRPKIIISVGTVAIHTIFGDSSIELKDAVGRRYEINPLSALSQNTVVIPLPHPSGLSTWIHKKENKHLLTQALVLIKTEIRKLTPVTKSIQSSNYAYSKTI
jgi:uracil-DNA glycosylase